MKKNSEDLLTEILLNIKSLSELRSNIMNFPSDFESECREEEEKEEEVDDHPIFDSLKKDYEDFMNWAFATKDLRTSKIKARKIWKKLHADLPMPRSLNVEVHFESEMATICLLMDAYPLYLESKKKCCGNSHC